MELGIGIMYNTIARPKRKLCRPPLVEYGLMGNDGRGQSIRLIPEVDEGIRGKNWTSRFRDGPCVLKAHWKGIVKDYRELSLSNEDRERIHNGQLRPMLQLWVEDAQDPIHWITFQNLPKLFRFALRRPLIPDRALQKLLDAIGVIDYLPSTAISIEHIDEERVSHVSTSYKQRIPKGNAMNGPQVTWVYEDQPLETPASKRAKNQVRFDLSKLSEDQLEIIEDIANAIDLCRSGCYTSDHAIDILYDNFMGFNHDYVQYLPEIEAGSESPNSLAERIYGNTHLGTPCPMDDDEDNDQVKRNQHETSDSCQDEDLKSSDHTVPKITITFKYDTKSRFQNIYQQVLSGSIALHKALLMFRSAIDKPGISDMELANLLVVHDIPFDLFFSSDHVKAQKPTPNESEEPCGLKAQNDTTLDPLTPQDSRRTSKLFNNNPLSLSRFTAPDTPPEDAGPVGDNELGASLPPHIAGNEDVELLIQALQNLIDPEPYDCLCIDDSSEEAEVPRIFFEKTPVIVTEDLNGKECSVNAMSRPIARVADGDSELKPGAYITIDHPSTIAAVDQTSLLSQACFAMRPVTHASEVRVPHLVPGSSMRARIRNESDIGNDRDTPNPDFREHNRSDWEGCPQAAPGGPPDDHNLICEHSSSPDCGETTALWGLAMPTTKARELGEKLGLMSDYVNENFRSETAFRYASRRLSKIGERRSIPNLKRNRSSPPSDPRKHKSRTHDEIILFAEDGDDHRSFVEKRLRAPTPMFPMRSRDRCATCTLCDCNCRRLELCPLETKEIGNVLPSIEPCDSLAKGVIQSSSKRDEFEAKCRSLSTYTPSDEKASRASGLFDNEEDFPKLTRRTGDTSDRFCLPTPAHSMGSLGSGNTAEENHMRVAKPCEATKSFDECTTTSVSHAARSAVPLFDNSINDWVKKGTAINSAIRETPEMQSTGSSIRDMSISTAFLPLTIASPSHTTHKTAQEPQKSPDVIQEKDSPPAVIARKCSVVTTMKSLKIAGEEIIVPIPAPLQPRLSTHTTSDSADSTIEHIEDASVGHASPGTRRFPSSVLQHDRSRIAQVDTGYSMYTTARAAEVESEGLSLPSSSSLQPTSSGHITSASMVGIIEHTEDPSTGDTSSSTGNPLSPFSPDDDPPISVCPSSPRSGKACLATTAPVSLRDMYLANPHDASLSGMSNSDALSRVNKAEQPNCTPLRSVISPSLKRNRTESNTSQIRPSARLRISSPFLNSNFCQDSNDAMDIKEDPQAYDQSSPSSGGSGPASHSANNDGCYRYTARKSNLLAKIDRYLIRVGRLPHQKVELAKPWTPDNVEAAAWNRGASPRVFLWGKRKQREQIKKYVANNRPRTRYFQNATAPASKSGTTTSLNKLFDKYRGECFPICTFFPYLLLTVKSKMTPNPPTQLAPLAQSNTSPTSPSPSTSPPCSLSSPPSPPPPWVSLRATASSPAGAPSAPTRSPNRQPRSRPCARSSPPTRTTSDACTSTPSCWRARPARKASPWMRPSSSGGCFSATAGSRGEGRTAPTGWACGAASWRRAGGRVSARTCGIRRACLR